MDIKNNTKELIKIMNKSTYERFRETSDDNKKPSFDGIRPKTTQHFRRKNRKQFNRKSNFINFRLALKRPKTKSHKTTIGHNNLNETSIFDQHHNFSSYQNPVFPEPVLSRSNKFDNVRYIMIVVNDFLNFLIMLS